MKELLIMAKSLGGGGSEVALIELINALPEELYNITLVLLDSDMVLLCGILQGSGHQGH